MDNDTLMRALLEKLKESVRIHATAQHALGRGPLLSDAWIQDFANNAVIGLAEIAADHASCEVLEVLEACPGCGCPPGDGRTPGCSHPMGCGFEG